MDEQVYYIYFVDGKQVTENEFDSLIDEAIETIAREDGIYYEWSTHNLSDNDYYDFIDNLYYRTVKELDETNTINLVYTFERCPFTVKKVFL